MTSEKTAIEKRRHYEPAPEKRQSYETGKKKERHYAERWEGNT